MLQPLRRFTMGSFLKEFNNQHLGDELRMVDPRSKVVGESLEPAAAILSTGHNANGVFWMDVERGKWISNSYYMDSLPKWVDTLNAKGFADLYTNRDWSLTNPLDEYYEADIATIKQPQVKKRIADKLKRLADGIILAKKPARNYSFSSKRHLALPIPRFCHCCHSGKGSGRTYRFNHHALFHQALGEICLIHRNGDTYLRLDRDDPFLAFLIVKRTA